MISLRGPAPIHHALLAERSHTGITIQTLSPHAFDEGVPLLQTPRPGIPIPPECTLAHLHDLLAPEGAKMLVEALRMGLHVPPYQPYGADNTSTYTSPPASSASRTRNAPGTSPSTSSAAGEEAEVVEGERIRHAPKITPADRQLLWTSASARHTALRERVLGPLWTHLRLRGSSSSSSSSSSSPSPPTPPPPPGKCNSKEKDKEKRVILEELEAVPVAESPETTSRHPGEGQMKEGSYHHVLWVQKAGGDNGNGKRRSRKGESIMEEEKEEEFMGLYYAEPGEGGRVVVQMRDGSWLRVGRIKVEGSTSKPAKGVLESMRTFTR